MPDHQRLARATLDTLAPTVAVIDTSGEILLTNRTWREFGPPESSGDDVGVNYLETTRGIDDEYARAAADGLEAVLAGDRDTFSLEYPCHSPQKRQWFLLQARRFSVGDDSLVAVIHVDITDRRLAEAETASALDALEREHETLEHVLDRIGGVLPAVTEAAVGATDREELEECVCAALEAETVYEGVAIGRASIAGETIEWRTESGLMPKLVTDIALEALAAGTTVTEQSLAALPISFGEVTYGVLAVNVADRDVFDRYELDVLDSLVHTVATAMNALQIQQLLVSDTVVSLEIEIEAPDHPLVALSDAITGPVRYRGMGDGVLFVSLEGAPEYGRIRETDGLESPTVLVRTDREVVMELSVEDDLVLTLADHGASIREFVAAAGHIRMDVDLPTERSARVIYDRFAERYGTVAVHSTRTVHRPVETPRDLADGLLDSLTDRQHTALTKAVNAGYYEWPRVASGPDLADAMGITRETLHQHLRAAEQKLLEGIVEAGAH